MKYTNTITAAFLIIGMSLFAGTAAAQPAQAQKNFQTEAQASAQAQTGLMQAVQQLQEQVQRLQERVAHLQNKVTSLEAQVNTAEAEATGQTQATGELNANGQRGPPEHAKNNKNKDNLGSKVSAEARAGDKQGIMATISAWLSDRGNNQAAEAVNQSDEEKSEEKTGDSEEADIQVNVQGQVEAGNNVTVVASSDGAKVVNATVKVNGEVVGKTDNNGEITVTVPEGDEFEVEVETESANGELRFKLDNKDSKEVETQAQLNTNAEAETSNESTSAEVDIETQAKVEAGLS